MKLEETTNLTLTMSLLFEGEKELTKRLKKTETAIALYSAKRYSKLAEYCVLRNESKIELFAKILPEKMKETVINSQSPINDEVILQLIERVKKERNRGVFINVLSNVQPRLDIVNENYVFFVRTNTDLRFELEKILDIKSHIARVQAGGKVDIADLIRFNADRSKNTAQQETCC